MSDIGNWFKSLPIFTRHWFAASVALPVLGGLRLIQPWYLIFDYSSFVYRFQIWRPFTALFFYPLGFKYLLNLFFLYSYSLRLETGLFAGRPADYFFMLLFNFFCILIAAIFVGMSMFMDSMVMSVLYIWCTINKDVIVTFWFGSQFKAIYLPLVLCVLEFFMGRGFIFQLIGVLVGHLYYFMTHIYPTQYGGRAFLQTPQILYSYFPNTGLGGGFRPAFREQSNNQGGGGGGRHSWGRGHVLGDS